MSETKELIPRIKNQWVRCLVFFSIWIVSTSAFYLLLVVPFYPDSFPSKNSDYFFYPDNFFLILTNIANLLGVLVAFWIMKYKIENNIIRSIFIFNLCQISKGSLVGFVIVLVCLLIYLACDLISLTYISFSNVPILIIVFLLIAVTEELFFRGYILDTFLKEMNPRKAIVWSSLIFSLLHISNSYFGVIGFINIFICGILIGYFYYKTKNLSMSIGTHFTWNLFQYFFGFAVSGQKFDAVFSIKYNSTITFLTGGEFGMEGSIILIPICLTLLFIIKKAKKFA